MGAVPGNSLNILLRYSPFFLGGCLLLSSPILFLLFLDCYRPPFPEGAWFLALSLLTPSPVLTCNIQGCPADPMASSGPKCSGRGALGRRSLPDLSNVNFDEKRVEVEPLIAVPGTSWTPSQLEPLHLKCSSKVSLASSTSSPLCRICHLELTSARDPLISPCRCAGSLLYVHRSCLVHWLELSTRKMVPSPRCELCGYLYRRGTICDVRGVHLPRLNMRDRLLNLCFLVVMCIMVTCATISIHYLRIAEQFTATVRGYRVVSSTFSNDDMTVVICTILFFFAFFVAIFTQYRAEASVFRFLFRFWVINRNWTIRNYNILDDPEMLAVRQARGQLVRPLSPVKSSKNSH